MTLRALFLSTAACAVLLGTSACGFNRDTLTSPGKWFDTSDQDAKMVAMSGRRMPSKNGQPVGDDMGVTAPSGTNPYDTYGAAGDVPATARRRPVENMNLASGGTQQAAPVTPVGTAPITLRGVDDSYPTLAETPKTPARLKKTKADAPARLADVNATRDAAAADRAGAMAARRADDAGSELPPIAQSKPAAKPLLKPLDDRDLAVLPPELPPAGRGRDLPPSAPAPVAMKKAPAELKPLDTADVAPAPVAGEDMPLTIKPPRALGGNASAESDTGGEALNIQAPRGGTYRTERTLPPSRYAGRSRE